MRDAFLSRVQRESCSRRGRPRHHRGRRYGRGPDGFRSRAGCDAATSELRRPHVRWKPRIHDDRIPARDHRRRTDHSLPLDDRVGPSARIRRRAAHGNALVASRPSAWAFVAYLLDRFVAPNGLRPGFEELLSSGETTFIYVVLAGALAIGLWASATTCCSQLTRIVAECNTAVT